MTPTEERFNAATARRPWRTSHRQGWQPSGRASMRPQPEGRGEHALLDGDDSSASALQCGHSPKAVENVSTAKTCLLRAVKLQCGHSPKAVENHIQKSSQADRKGCFNAATARRPWRTSCVIWIIESPRKASMRPQPEGCGELDPLIRSRTLAD